MGSARTSPIQNRRPVVGDLEAGLLEQPDLRRSAQGLKQGAIVTGCMSCRRLQHEAIYVRGGVVRSWQPDGQRQDQIDIVTACGSDKATIWLLTRLVVTGMFAIGAGPTGVMIAVRGFGGSVVVLMVRLIRVQMLRT